MNDNAKAWLKNLRSGEFLQGTGSLWNKERNTYCCLGVACATYKTLTGSDDSFTLNGGWFGDYAEEPELGNMLPTSVRDWLGLKDLVDGDQDDGPLSVDMLLADRNDGFYIGIGNRMDFDEIANYIEEHEGEFFV